MDSQFGGGGCSHGSAGPQLLAALRPPGPSAGAGRERGAARGGARSGRAHVPGLSEQRREVVALPSARSSRVWVLPGVKPLAVGGTAGRERLA